MFSNIVIFTTNANIAPIAGQQVRRPSQLAPLHRLRQVHHRGRLQGGLRALWGHRGDMGPQGKDSIKN